MRLRCTLRLAGRHLINNIHGGTVLSLSRNISSANSRILRYLIGWCRTATGRTSRMVVFNGTVFRVGLSRATARLPYLRKNYHLSASMPFVNNNRLIVGYDSSITGMIKRLRRAKGEEEERRLRGYLSEGFRGSKLTSAPRLNEFISLTNKHPRFPYTFKRCGILFARLAVVQIAGRRERRIDKTGEVCSLDSLRAYACCVKKRGWFERAAGDIICRE